MTDGGIGVMWVGFQFIFTHLYLHTCIYLCIFNANQQQCFLLISVFKKFLYLILLWVIYIYDIYYTVIK